MGWVGNIFGIGTPNNSGGFQAKGVDQGQLNQAQDQTQLGLSQQQAFVNQLNAQNGLGNQNSVFNQMQGTADQLQGLANGQGPNPALAQLNQTTGQNIAGQNALMAGQRGAGANAGLIARQAAMQGGNIQQQAVGQAATMGAQQQIAALQGLQSQQANLANLSTQQVGQQAGGIGNYNQFVQGNQGQLLGGQASQNTVNSSIAQANQKAGAGLIGGILGGVGAAQVAAGGMVNDDGSVMYADGGPVPQNPISIGFNNATMNGLSKGQTIPPPTPPKKYADGGPVNTVAVSGPQSFAGKFLMGANQPAPQESSQKDPYQQSGQALGQGLRYAADKVIGAYNTPSVPVTGATTGAAAGANLGAVESGGGAATGVSAGAEAGAAAEAGEGAEGILALLADGGEIAQYDSGSPTPTSPIATDIMGTLGEVTSHFSKGSVVPGQASKKGDSLKNDTVPALLSPGEIVLPRSVTQSQDPVGEAARFVQAIMAKKGRRR